MDPLIIRQSPQKLQPDDPLSVNQMFHTRLAARELYLSVAPEAALDWVELTVQQQEHYVNLVLVARRATILCPMEAM